MNDAQYIGLDVHQATISVAVLDATGKLADLLRTGLLSAVYHGENGLRTLKELARSYLALNRDVTWVMNRLKALYRSWAIPCAGQRVYAPRSRNQWLAQIIEAGVRQRAEICY